MASDAKELKDFTADTAPLHTDVLLKQATAGGDGTTKKVALNDCAVLRSTSAADPTTTELPADGDAGIHKNTTSSNVYLAYNDGGSTIVKVQLT